MLDVSTTSVKDLLAYAIRSEMDSNKAYKDLADRVSNPLLKEKFHWLAFEENKHKQVLIRLHEALFSGQTIQIPDKPSEELLKRIEITPTSSLVDLLFQAMESEKSAEEFYARLAERMENAQKRLLQYLSKVEHSHYVMLKSEYDAVQDFEDYAEKDIDKIIT
ncbi:MAG: ferritin family protein [Candidatus Aminicenantes bacterium]|jgi:rubrerythrin|nr:ferritin family protein [Candidatus Aminicenantes bacterium]MDH5385225.1 ferritin family protein [Candidatus Aminicenantes bacterium]